MAAVGQDIRYGLRRLGRNPGSSAIAALTLALGVGATCTIFSVVDAVLLRPLPFQDPDRLIAISQTARDSQGGGAPVSFTKFQAVQDQALTLKGLAVYYTSDVGVGGEGEPERVAGARVSGDLLGMLGEAPALGRGFSPAEMAPGGADVALISDGLWRRRFGGDPALVGRGVRLDGRNVTVVGILSPAFRFPLETPEPQVWLPRAFEPDFLTPAQVHSGAGYLSLVARLRRGRTIAEAQSELATIDARYRGQYGSYVDATQFQLRAASLAESLVGASRPSLLVLMAAVGFVLVIACANVASLQLARASGRAGEMAVRKALGASRPRLVGQLLFESLGLSFLGSVLGLGFAVGAVGLARSVAGGVLPRLEQARVDGPVLLFSLGLSVATALVFGVAPALHASRGDLQGGLRRGGRGSSDGTARRGLRGLFVAQAAVAVLLLTGAGLLIRTLAGLLNVDPGFEARGVITIPIDLPPSRYAEPAGQVDFFRQLVARVDGIPGVRSAAATSYLPLSGSTRFVFFCPEGRVCLGIGKDPVIAQRQVTPGYFDATRTRVLQGRVFDETDTVDSVPVVIVNETTARRYWPGANPLGKHLANSRDRVQREVVGVVADVKFRALSAPSVEEMYLPLAQSPWPTMTVLVRSDSDPGPLIAAVRREISRVDPDIAIQGAETMDAVVRGSLAQPQLLVRVVALFATLALLLAAVGLYGVMAYSVAERTREFGVRMALGATPRDILGSVLKEGMGLALAGVAAGLVLSLWLTQLLAGLLFGVSATDPVTFGGAGCILVATALLASYMPARRSLRLDPVRALRDD